MVSIIKYCALLLFTVTMPIHATNTSSTQPDNELHFSLAETVSTDELASARGREGGFDVTAINNANLQATLTGNAANNNTTGMNIIDHGAFKEASGMFSVIQNSGNNVIIQDVTNVNVTIAP